MSRDASHSKHKFRRRIGIFLFLAVGVYLLPWIVASTPLGKAVVRHFTSSYPGRIDLQAMQLGWFAPLEFSKIHVEDLEGETLLEVERVITERSLLAILLSPSELGLVRIEEPRVHLVIRADGSNLEDLLTKMLEQDSGSSLGCTLQISDGQLVLVDQQSGREWTSNSLESRVTLSTEPNSPLSVELRGKVGSPSADVAPGQFAAALHMETPAGESHPIGKFTVQCDQVSLAPIEPIVHRFAGNLQLRGTATGKFLYQWQTGKSYRMEFEGLKVHQFELSAADWLGQEVLRDSLVELDGAIEQAGSEIAMQQLRARGQLAQFEANGRFAMDSDAGFSWKSLQRLQLIGPSQVQAKLQLARLAQAVPRLLRVRENTQMTAGEVELVAQGTPNVDAQQWELKLIAAGLEAQNEGRPLKWPHAIRLDLLARQQPGTWAVDRLHCTSSFLQLDGQGTPEQGELTARVDLDKLASDVGLFVDVSEFALSGTLQAKAKWTNEGPRWTADATAQLNGWQLGARNGRVWSEPDLNVRARAVAMLDQLRPRSVEQASLELRTATDQLNLQLTSPVHLAGELTEAQLPIQAELRGSLRSWLARAGILLPGLPAEIEGQAHLQARGAVSRQRVELASAELRLQDVQLTRDTLTVREPAVQITAAGYCDLAASRVALSKFTCQSGLLMIEADAVEAQWSGERKAAQGRLRLQADVGRLARLLAPEGTTYPEGQLALRLNVENQAAQTTLAWEGQVEPLILRQKQVPGPPAGFVSASTRAPEGAILWHEDRLELRGRAQYDAATDRLALSPLDVAGYCAALVLEGKVDQVSTDPRAALQGQWTYDWQRLSEQLTRIGITQVQLRGRRTRDLTLEGPLRAPAVSAATGGPGGSTSTAAWIAQFKAATKLAWDSGDVYGVAVGPAELNLTLADAVVRADPANVPVGGGQLQIAPLLQLNKQPATLVFHPAPVLSNVRLTPVMCHSWLKYVAPLLADATSAEGLLSVRCERLQVPIATPEKLEVRGRLVIHEGRIGPGPLAREFLLLSEQVQALVERRLPRDVQSSSSNTWMRLPTQEIPFEVAQGRVVHRNLSMQVGDTVVRTDGSVGLDQSLSLLAQVPIQPRWLRDERLAAAFGNQVLQVPIAGTLREPRLDRSGMDAALQDLLRRSATGLIGQELDRQLQRLFGPAR